MTTRSRPQREQFMFRDPRAARELPVLPSTGTPSRRSGRSARRTPPRRTTPAAPHQDPWFLGYAAALAEVCRLHGNDRLARSVLHHGGLSLAHLESGGVEESDLAVIRDACVRTRSEAQARDGDRVIGQRGHRPVGRGSRAIPTSRCRHGVDYPMTRCGQCTPSILPGIVQDTSRRRKFSSGQAVEVQRELGRDWEPATIIGYYATIRGNWWVCVPGDAEPTTLPPVAYHIVPARRIRRIRAIQSTAMNETP